MKALTENGGNGFGLPFSGSGGSRPPFFWPILSGGWYRQTKMNNDQRSEPIAIASLCDLFIQFGGAP
jgi:hypothetical protein